MNTVLWIAQVLLGFMFIMVGGLKLAIPREKLLASGLETGRKNMAWAEDFTTQQVRLIGFAELLGGVGLLLPSWTGIIPVLTPIAAVCLALLMIGAVVVHLRRKESDLVTGPVMLALAAAFVAVGRLLFFPL
jgi:uncharacterized membrane protein YphA (DoxX/SURF4 family)